LFSSFSLLIDFLEDELMIVLLTNNPKVYSLFLLIEAEDIQSINNPCLTTKVLIALFNHNLKRY